MWKVDVQMNCDESDNGWFELKGFASFDMWETGCEPRCYMHWVSRGFATISGPQPLRAMWLHQCLLVGAKWMRN